MSMIAVSERESRILGKSESSARFSTKHAALLLSVVAPRTTPSLMGRSSVYSLVKSLEAEAIKAGSLETGGKRNPRRMFEGERVKILKQLEGDAVKESLVQTTKHLGAAARMNASSPGSVVMKEHSSISQAVKHYNSSKDRDFAEELVHLSKEIGKGLSSEHGNVPANVWRQFDKLESNRRFFRKEVAELESGSQSRSVCGPGSYSVDSHRVVPGGKLPSSSRDDDMSGKSSAQREAVDRIRSSHSSVVWSNEERHHLQRLFEELGRQKRGHFVRGDEFLEELLEDYARRHTLLFSDRSRKSVKDKVWECLCLNRFKEEGETKHWRALKASGGRAASPNERTTPAWSMGRRIDSTSIPSASFETYDYRSIGKQLSSEKPDASSATFGRAGAAGTTLTIAETLARLGPTATTYHPQYTQTHHRSLAYPWKQEEGAGMSTDSSPFVGPGSYEAPQPLGPQAESHRRNPVVVSVPRTRTGRLPLESEPRHAKYSAAISLPPPPYLPPLPP